MSASRVQKLYIKKINWERATPPAEINPVQFDYTAEDAILVRLKLS
jgi:hypothetical protein